MSAATRGPARSAGTGRTMATKQRLFEAAVELIGQRGADAVTVDEIAAAAGVAKGTVYYNFGSKNELVQQLLRYGMDLLMARLRDDPAPNSQARAADPFSEVAGMVQRSLAFIGEYPSFVRLWLGEQWRADGAWQALLAQMRAEVLAEIEAAVRRIEATRPLRAGLTPSGVAVALFGAAFVTGMDRAAFKTQRSLDEACEAVLALIRGAFPS